MTTTTFNDNFYEWFTNIGGNMALKDYGKLVENHQTPLQRTSSLKKDPERIKRLYNHKFKQNDPY